MGFNTFKPSSSERIVTGNPDPKKFRIIKTFTYLNCTAIMVIYSDCINFEGVKILVIEDYVESSYLDPHFSLENKLLARFRPVDKGWDNAVRFVKLEGDV